MKLLITGATGMLGSAFAEQLGDDAILVDRVQLEFENPKALYRLVALSGAEALINCAAHVDAERGETDPDPVYASNAILPGVLATACRRAGIPLVHFSSTGCYGTGKQTPYTEEDAVAPTTVHHRSKIAGERAVREAGCEHLILRTGWLFGGLPMHKKNFVWRRLVEAATIPRLSSDTAQFGNPTFVGDVVSQCLDLLRLEVRGTFNCVAQGTASRFEYVARIVAASGFACELLPSGPFARVAPVSWNEMAVNYRLGLMGLDRMPAWTASVDCYVAALQASPEWQALMRMQSASTEAG